MEVTHLSSVKEMNQSIRKTEILRRNTWINSSIAVLLHCLSFHLTASQYWDNNFTVVGMIDLICYWSYFHRAVSKFPMFLSLSPSFNFPNWLSTRWQRASVMSRMVYNIDTKICSARTGASSVFLFVIRVYWRWAQASSLVSFDIMMTFRILSDEVSVEPQHKSVSRVGINNCQLIRTITFVGTIKGAVDLKFLSPISKNKIIRTYKTWYNVNVLVSWNCWYIFFAARGFPCSHCIIHGQW